MNPTPKPADAYTFAQYESEVSAFAQYPNLGDNLIYPALGLVGEAGEVAEKIKKLWRNQNKMSAKECAPADLQELAKEVGDVLWYIQALARELGIPLAEIAANNSKKLSDRAARNVIKSAGDNR